MLMLNRRIKSTLLARLSASPVVALLGSRQVGKTTLARGHLSIIRRGPDGQPYYNLQHRENGRNVTEYIPRDQVPAVEKNIAAHEHFKVLVDEHIDEVSSKSRQERKATVKKKPQPTKPSTLPTKKKSKS